MIILFAAAATFQAVAAEADVTTSNGKHYRLETCFRDPHHLVTRFLYPARTETFSIDGETAITSENGSAAAAASDTEKRVAIGHNFHAIYFNLPRLVSDNGNLVYGGSLVPRSTTGRRFEGYTFNSPDTTPIEVHFFDWRADGRIPYRVTLTHSGVTYDYRFSRIKFRC